MFVFLKMAKSKLSIPGPRSTESTRDSVPGPKSGGFAKQLVLNQFVICPPPACLSHPETTSGRMLLTPRLAASKGVEPAIVIFSGKPRWKVVMPSMPHPETKPFAIPVKLDAYALPCPKGRSRTQLITRRCETSGEDSDRSPFKLFQSCTPPTPPVGPSSQLVRVSVLLRSFALVYATNSVPPPWKRRVTLACREL